MRNRKKLRVFSASCRFAGSGSPGPAWYAPAAPWLNAVPPQARSARVNTVLSFVNTRAVFVIPADDPAQTVQVAPGASPTP